MNHEQFISEVEQRISPIDGYTGEQVAQATLEVLGHRLFGNENAHLAAQLPAGIKDYLLSAETSEAFGPAEFVQQVAAKEGVDPRVATQHVRAVMAVLSAAVSEGEIEDVWAQLPAEYASLI